MVLDITIDVSLNYYMDRFSGVAVWFLCFYPSVLIIC